MLQHKGCQEHGRCEEGRAEWKGSQGRTLETLSWGPALCPRGDSGLRASPRPETLVKMQTLVQQVWGRASNLMFLISPQVMPRLGRKDLNYSKPSWGI